MSKIIFHCLVKPAEAEDLAAAFRRALSAFAQRGRVSEPEVSFGSGAADEQLVSQWELENPEQELADRAVFRYELSFATYSGSLNELAMDLSELLTPRADLPPDAVLREFDELLQNAATYPWNVAVYR